MTEQTDRAAEWTPVTPEPREGADREEVGRELDGLRVRLGMSVREMAEKVSVDRTTLKRFLEGDPKMRAAKWRSIEKHIRALDKEMGPDPETAPAQIATVELRDGEAVVKGPIANLAELQEALERIVQRRLQRDGVDPLS